MPSMRRAERAVMDSKGLYDILQSAKVLRLGMIVNGKVYIVPMNYGFDASPDTQPETWRLFVHSANQGSKIAIMRKNPVVSFELDSGHALRAGETACQYGFSYASIMGEAVVRFLYANDDKRDALTLLMDHQAHEGGWTFSDESLSRTAVLALRITSMTGKMCPHNE